MFSVQSIQIYMYCMNLMVATTAVTGFVVSPSKRMDHLNLMKEGLLESTDNLSRVASKLYSEKDTKDANSEDGKPLLEPLQPFIPAMDPNYMNIGPVGEKDFIVSRTGSPTKEELSNENLYKILKIECSDLEVNTLVWKCLGYRFIENENGDGGEWKSEKVFPKWGEKFPTPPDLIGMQRIYTKEVDQVSLKANQNLVRSVPVDNKQSLKTHLRPLGFTGYKVCMISLSLIEGRRCSKWFLPVSKSYAYKN